jgi:hypothetical protein
MRPVYLSDGKEHRGYGGGSFSKTGDGSSLFWWTILITLMMGVATFCWFFSIMVFQHPEKPLNYKVLAKLDKLPVIRKFTVYTVPDGSAKSPRELLAGYYAYSAEQLRVANDILKRAYIRNYDKQDPPVYLTGKFEALEVRKLADSDVMQAGWVVRARAVDLEDVDVEILMPGLNTDGAPFEVGEAITLDKRATFGALIHVEKIGAERVCGTVVPLVYSGFKSTAGDALTMVPPVVLNLEAGWPVSADPGVAAKVVSTELKP